MAGSKKWVVTTSGQRPIAEIQEELQQGGFAVEQSLGEIGIVTGTADDDAAERARAVAGVEDVSPDSPINIGPPGSDLTW